MIDLIIRYSTVSRIGAEAERQQERFKEMRKSLDTLVDSLEVQWNGAGRTEFEAAYNKVKPVLKDVSSLLRKYTKELKTVVDSEQALEKQNADAYKSIIF